MATQKKNVNAPKVKGLAVTPKGVMPADKLARFGLKAEYNTPSFETGRGRMSDAQNRWVKKMVQLAKYSRAMFRVAPKEDKLPVCIKNAIRYMAVPLTLEEGVRAHSRRSLDTRLPSEETGADPRQVPLKV